ncbi:MAG TPA: hypothetical protein VI039_12425 [Solirubrobacterales bacterium]
MKKLLLLATAALLALAVVVPASASASTWGYGMSGEGPYQLEPGETASEVFTGWFGREAPGVSGSHGCLATIEIEGKAGTVGRVVSLTRDFENCWGTGYWSNWAPVVGGFSNVSSGWSVNISSAPQISKAAGNIEVGTYVEPYVANPRMQYWGNPWSLVPNLDESGRLLGFTLKGIETNGVSATIGQFTATEGPLELELYML